MEQNPLNIFVFSVFWISLLRNPNEGAKKRYTALSEVEISLGSLYLCHLVSFAMVLFMKGRHHKTILGQLTQTLGKQK